ncbi:MAG: hypothetical protein ACJ74K_17455 [Actinomycetes bacterium]
MASGYAGSQGASTSGSSSTSPCAPGTSRRSSPRSTRSWATAPATAGTARYGASSAKVWVVAATSVSGPRANRAAPGRSTLAASGAGPSRAIRYST